jgi:alpha-L-rhamnosidase
MIEGITWVKASKDTPYGLLEVSWEKNGNDFSMEVSVPVGCSATVYLPNGTSKELVSGNHVIKE